MPVQYNKVRDDQGKGRQMLRRGVTGVALASGTVFALLDQVPANIVIKRILIGTAVATNLTGNIEVLALAKGSALDTAAAAGNRLMTPITGVQPKTVRDSSAVAAGSPGALTALAQAPLAADTVLVLSVTHNAAVVGGDVEAIVEYDVVSQTYGAYDGDSTSQGAYQ